MTLKNMCSQEFNIHISVNDLLPKGMVEFYQRLL